MNKQEIAKKMHHTPRSLETLDKTRRTKEITAMRKHYNKMHHEGLSKDEMDSYKQKGKASLNRASGTNEGDKMTLGKNENNRF